MSAHCRTVIWNAFIKNELDFVWLNKCINYVTKTNFKGHLGQPSILYFNTINNSTLKTPLINHQLHNKQISNIFLGKYSEKDSSLMNT